MSEAELDGARLKALRELKGIRTQQALATLVGASQPHICDLESGKLRNPRVFVKVADALDCTTDFLFRRGPFKDADDPLGLRRAASEMAFDVFADRLNVSAGQKDRCDRVRGHPKAPVTADDWEALAEMIDRAIGPTTPIAGRIGA